ncbi:hypothetical protein PIB30_084838 [Stylosanthes scabra]|uniref:Putative plant transposon protein domain-containing protein n=1 Tax=Stylosanthes scabra TaxID=79078 RepID=A0ABU6URG9_9FABA|nr:hypothetical protein [Stylosanthes scabra]
MARKGKQPAPANTQQAQRAPAHKGEPKGDLTNPSSEPHNFCNAISHRYYKKLLDRKVHSKRKLDILDHMKDFVEDLINHHQWQFLHNGPVEINETLLREFYGNFYGADLQTVFLRQHEIDISEKAIAGYLKIQVVPKTKDAYEKAISDKNMGRLNWERILKQVATHAASWTLSDEKIPRTASLEMNFLTLEARVWQQIVANYVMPSTHELSITANVAILIWLILERKKVNLAAKVGAPWEIQDLIYRVPSNKRSLPHGNWCKVHKAPKRKRKRSGDGTSTESSAPLQQPQHFHQFSHMVIRELASIKRKIIRNYENSKKLTQEINPRADFSSLEPHTPESEQTESDSDSGDEIPPMDL